MRQLEPNRQKRSTYLFLVHPVSNAIFIFSLHTQQFTRFSGCLVVTEEPVPLILYDPHSTNLCHLTFLLITSNPIKDLQKSLRCTAYVSPSNLNLRGVSQWTNCSKNLSPLHLWQSSKQKWQSDWVSEWITNKPRQYQLPFNYMFWLCQRSSNYKCRQKNINQFGLIQTKPPVHCD